jgi:ABC-type phosphate transport system permease subunit
LSSKYFLQNHTKPFRVIHNAVKEHTKRNLNAAWHELALSLLPPIMHSSIEILAETPDELISAAVSLGSAVENNN